MTILKHGQRFECIDMIINAANILKRTEDLYTGYLRLISYIGNKINVEDILTELLKKEEIEELDLNFNIDLLRRDTRDLLTESLEESGLIIKTNSFRFKKLIDKKLEDILLLKEVYPIILIEPRQSSRIIVELYNRIGNKCLYCCVEPDILQYRIGLINKTLFDISAMNLNVDPSIHNTKLNSSNWYYVNKWSGVPTEKIELIG